MFMTNNMVEDFNKASVVASGKKSEVEYDKIYHASNEDLNMLFSNFSVEGKDVLTVCGSGDQAFYSCLGAAKDVDIFDINKLTYYYFLLRKWSIEYLGEYYPPKDISKNRTWLKNLLGLVQCKNYEEQSALLFWHLFMKRASEDNNANLFYNISNYQRNSITDVQSLRERIADKDFGFIREDITGDVEKSKKYDVVIASNILEYCQRNILKLIRTRDNLYSILKPEGIVVCSNLIRPQDSESATCEQTLFRSFFDRYDFTADQDGKSCGYVYQRR